MEICTALSTPIAALSTSTYHQPQLGRNGAAWLIQICRPLVTGWKEETRVFKRNTVSQENLQYC